MYGKLVWDRGPAEDHELLDFLTAMLRNGAAGCYRWQKQDDARAKSAEDVANQAGERFGQVREVLQRLEAAFATTRRTSCNVS